MDNNYIYNDNTGVITVDTSSIKSEIQQEFKDALGLNISLEDSTPQGRLIDAETTSRSAVINNNALLANLFNLDLAYGVFLDALAGSFLFERQGATQSQVIATITGISGTVIPANSQASTSQGVIFYTENDITIPESGSIDAVFLSQEFGPIACPVGALTKIIDGTFGWETITNNISATLGQEKQSDASFKKAIHNSGLFSGKALLDDYRSAIYGVDGVSSAFVYDNYNKQDIVYDGITIKANSIYCCVMGGSNQDVAEAIFKVKSSGCAWTGNTSVQITEPTFGGVYTVEFQRPTPIPIYVNAIAKNINSSATDLDQQIKNAIINYANGNIDGFDNLGIGKDIQVFDLATVIGSVINGITIESITIGTQSDSLSVNTININISQISQFVADNITVTIN